MLDLDLDLEADLGVDTVKQAEVFAAIREAYNISRDDNLQLRDYNTLSRVIDFVYERATDLAKPETEKKTEDKKEKSPLDHSSVIKGDLAAANSIPRRMPTPKLRPQLDMCTATGIALEKGDRVIVMSDKGGVAKSLVSLLKSKGIDTIELNRSGSASDLEKQLTKLNTDKTVKGVYWLAALDNEKEISKMNYKTWREENRVRVKLLYTTMRTLYDSNPFLVSATRLGGQFGRRRGVGSGELAVSP